MPVIHVMITHKSWTDDFSFFILFIHFHLAFQFQFGDRLFAHPGLSISIPVQRVHTRQFACVVCVCVAGKRWILKIDCRQQATSSKKCLVNTYVRLAIANYENGMWNWNFMVVGLVYFYLFFCILWLGRWRKMDTLCMCAASLAICVCCCVYERTMAACMFCIFAPFFIFLFSNHKYILLCVGDKAPNSRRSERTKECETAVCTSMWHG